MAKKKDDHAGTHAAQTHAQPSPQPVGAGDLGNAWQHVRHLIADLYAGDTEHARTHVLEIMRELLAAADGGPNVMRSADPNQLKAIADELKACCPPEGEGHHPQAVGAAGDWKGKLFEILLKLLPLLL